MSLRASGLGPKLCLVPTSDGFDNPHLCLIIDGYKQGLGFVSRREVTQLPGTSVPTAERILKEHQHGDHGHPDSTG